MNTKEFKMIIYSLFTGGGNGKLYCPRVPEIHLPKKAKVQGTTGNIIFLTATK